MTDRTTDQTIADLRHALDNMLDEVEHAARVLDMFETGVREQEPPVPLHIALGDRPNPVVDPATVIEIEDLE